MIDRKLNPPSLLLVVLLALVVRLISLADHSLWYDEAFSVLFAQQSLGTMIEGTTQAVEHPLLYYAALGGWMQLLGTSAAAARLFSVVMGVALVIVVDQVGRMLFTVRTGRVAALLVALAPFQIQYAQEARMYSLLALLLLVTTLLFLRGWRAQRGAGRWWVGLGMVAGMAMHTQQLAGFYLLALGLAPLLLRRRDLVVRMVGAGLIALAIFSPWLLTLPAQLERFGQQYWIQAPSSGALLLSLRIFLAGGLEVESGLSLALIGLALFVLVMLVVQVIVYARKPRRRAESDSEALIIAGWLAAAPVGFMWLFSQVAPVYLERALIGSAVMLLVLLAWLVTRSGLPRAIAGVVLVAVTVLFGAGILAQWRLDTFPYSPVHEAADAIRARGDDDAIIVHMNKLSALPGVAQAPDLRHAYLADAPGSPEDTLAAATQAALGVVADACIQAAAANAETVYLMIYARAEREFAAAGRNDVQVVRDFLERLYRLQETLHVNDLIIYVYDERRIRYPTDCVLGAQ